MKYLIKRAEPEQRELFYPCAEYAGAYIGYLRIDFGAGEQFYSTWFDSGSELNTKAFKAEIDDVINTLRGSLLKSRRDMERFLTNYGGQPLENGWCGFTLEAENSCFFFRCKPQAGDYECYCHCYNKTRFELLRQQDQTTGPEIKL